MKYILKILLLLAFFPACDVNGQETNNYLNFANSKALHEFYRYSENAPTIIQGHRGTKENGLPESSIAAFEYVLSQMPAVFEIDPRLTKDSVIIVLHDETLDRTTNGTGKVSDYSWAELQKLNLKNAKGEITPYKINTLAEILEWAKEKTVLVLDKKDVPLRVIADMIRQHDANNYVINMVRSTEDALFYYRDEPQRMFAVSIRNPEIFQDYMNAGIPKTQMFACIGVQINEQTEILCKMMSENGIRCLIATATSHDKLKTKEERAEAYRKIIESGVTMLESNYPVEVGKALSTVKED